MASERHRDGPEAGPPDLSQPPFPLPSGWVYYAPSPDASLETLRRVAGSLRYSGQVRVGSMFDEDADRDTQDLLYSHDGDRSRAGE